MIALLHLLFVVDEIGLFTLITEMKRRKRT